MSRGTVGFNELAYGGPRVSGRLEDGGGGSAKAVLAKLKSFTRACGRPAFARCAHSHGLDASGPDDHDVDGPGVVVDVGENQVGPFVVSVISGDELLPVDGSTSPAVQDFVQGVSDSFMSSHGPRTIRARNGVVTERVTVARAGIACR